MKKLLLISLFLLIVRTVLGQAVPDIIRTPITPPSGASENNRTTIDANLYLNKNLRIPRASAFTLNGAKDSIGYIMFNTISNRFGVYRGSGVWDTYIITTDLNSYVLKSDSNTVGLGHYVTPTYFNANAILTSGTSMLLGTINIDGGTSNGVNIGDISTNKAILNISPGSNFIGSTTDNATYTGFSYVGSTDMEFGLKTDAGSRPSELSFNPGGMNVIDQLNDAGLKYAGNYHANFTTRSLVDKGLTDSLYQAKLGFTPENVANKTATASTSTITYPNWLGVKNLVSGYVPYTGWTANVNGGVNQLFIGGGSSATLGNLRGVAPIVIEKTFSGSAGAFDKPYLYIAGVAPLGDDATEQGIAGIKVSLSDSTLATSSTINNVFGIQVQLKGVAQGTKSGIDDKTAYLALNKNTNTAITLADGYYVGHNSAYTGGVPEWQGAVTIDANAVKAVSMNGTYTTGIDGQNNGGTPGSFSKAMIYAPANITILKARNDAGSADLPLLVTDAADSLHIGSSLTVASNGGVVLKTAQPAGMLKIKAQCTNCFTDIGLFDNAGNQQFSIASGGSTSGTPNTSLIHSNGGHPISMQISSVQKIGISSTFLTFGQASSTNSLYDLTNNYLGLAMASGITPTNTLSLGAAGNGLAIYNVDGSNNERLVISPISNVWTFNSTSTGSGQNRNFSFVGGQVNLSGGFGTAGQSTNANMIVSAGTATSTSANSSIQLNGSASMAYRAMFNGNTSSSLAVNQAYVNFGVGNTPITTPASGTVPVIANLGIAKLGTITSGGATIPLVTNLFVDTAPTGGTLNTSAYINGATYINGSATATSHVTVGGTTSQVISGTGSLLTYNTGTLTSITPGYGFTSSTPITTAATLTIDTTKVQTVTNFTTKGNLTYLQLAGGNMNSGAQLNINNGAIALFGTNQTTAPSSYLTNLGLKVGTSGNLTHNFISYNNGTVTFDNGSSLFTNTWQSGVSGTIALVGVGMADSRYVVSATSPLSISGGTISLAGLTGLGTSNQVLGMNNAGTGYEYKTTSVGTGLVLSTGTGTLSYALKNPPNTNYLSAQTGALTINTITSDNGGSSHTYRIGASLNITSVSIDVIRMDVTYTDENSTSQTASFYTQGATSAGLSAIGNSVFPSMDIIVKSNTTLTVKTTLVTGTGSVIYDAQGTITEIN